MTDMKVLLLGGNGFLGKSLQQELNNQGILFEVLDINDCDLSDIHQIDKLCCKMHNFTNVVLLAAKLGIQTFNNPYYATKASKYNAAICENVLKAIRLSKNKNIDLTYYTTSELYGSLKSKDDIISTTSSYSYITDCNRGQYAMQKFIAMQMFSKAHYFSELRNFKTIKPFNIYGPGQCRGVVYEMIKSALQSQTITYNADTTRTFTDINLCSKLSVDVILSDCEQHINVADGRCSLTLKSLANIIDTCLFEYGLISHHCKLIESEPDKFVRYR